MLIMMMMMLLKMLLVVATVRLCSSACSPWVSALDPVEDFSLFAASNPSPSTVGSMTTGSMMASMKDTSSNKFTESLLSSMIPRSVDVNTIKFKCN